MAGSEGKGESDTEANIRMYDSLLSEWYETSQELAELNTGPGQPPEEQTTIIQTHLKILESEIDRITEEFKDEEYERVIRSVLKR